MALTTVREAVLLSVDMYARLSRKLDAIDERRRR
jgi:hypothetical protein